MGFDTDLLRALSQKTNRTRMSESLMMRKTTKFDTEIQRRSLLFLERINSGEIDYVFWIDLRIIKNDVHVFEVVGAGFIEALAFVIGVNEGRSVQSLSTPRRSTTNRPCVDQA